MKVKYLIERLQRFDPEAPVVIHGLKGGFSCIQSATEVPVCWNVNEGLHDYGEHDHPKPGQEPDVTVICIC